MTDLSTRNVARRGPVIGGQRNPAPRIYDRKSLTYADTFENPLKRHTIKAIEWMTGKIQVIRRIRQFEKAGVPSGYEFWPATMRIMGIEIQTPTEQLENIPQSGPVVFVSNHPHGMVDGMVLADLIGRRRDDFRILTRAILTGIDESAASYMIPVPFPHEDDSQRKMVEMRTDAMEHLGKGGLIALFPSGVVASANRMFGPAIEAEWNVFTAKMIRMSGATVVPCYFPGSNSRPYQLASRLSPTLRQGLLIHEIVHSFDRPQIPVIGKPIPPEEWADKAKDQRRFAAWLRERTLALKT